jgi:hypothetical protein
MSCPGVWYLAEAIPVTGNCALLPDDIDLTVCKSFIMFASSKVVRISLENTLRNNAFASPEAFI